MKLAHGRACPKLILENDKSVIYHGLQKNVVPFYKKCSCFLYPSFYPEGMSNVLLEAASSGRPVIAADRAGCREIVEDGITGFIVPINNEDAVLEAVEKFLRMSREERRQMGLRGRERVKLLFDWKIVVKAYIDLLETTDFSRKNSTSYQ